jgi:hypothetical protein
MDLDDPNSAHHLYQVQYDNWFGKWDEVNQLKYVCRQLNLETRSFGLDNTRYSSSQ